jgi:flavin reductase (DIM6/NTAB) family NADH-FMN oxidoreductase RutF
MQKPWNLIDTPIYSLVTTNINGVVNMNICTYVSAVSMQPKHYAIAVYNNTQTLENISKGSRVVLQVLAKEQISLVKKLGMQTGRSYNKQNYLSKKKLLVNWNDYLVLDKACAYVELFPLHSFNVGDHELFLFNVGKYKSIHKEVLMLNDLRVKKLIRI